MFELVEKGQVDLYVNLSGNNLATSHHIDDKLYLLFKGADHKLAFGTQLCQMDALFYLFFPDKFVL